MEYGKGGTGYVKFSANLQTLGNRLGHGGFAGTQLPIEAEDVATPGLSAKNFAEALGSREIVQDNSPLCTLTLTCHPHIP